MSAVLGAGFGPLRSLSSSDPVQVRRSRTQFVLFVRSILFHFNSPVRSLGDGNSRDGWMVINAGLLRDRPVPSGCTVGPGKPMSDTLDAESAGRTAARALDRTDRNTPAEVTSKYERSPRQDLALPNAYPTSRALFDYVARCHTPSLINISIWSCENVRLCTRTVRCVCLVCFLSSSSQGVGCCSSTFQLSAR